MYALLRLVIPRRRGSASSSTKLPDDPLSASWKLPLFIYFNKVSSFCHGLSILVSCLSLTLTSDSAGVAAKGPTQNVLLDASIQVLGYLRFSSVKETSGKGPGAVRRSSDFYEGPHDHGSSKKDWPVIEWMGAEGIAAWGLSGLQVIWREQKGSWQCTKLHRIQQRHPPMLIHPFP